MEVQPLPATFHFKDFAVSSNSESCNEEARTLYIEGHSVYGIAYAMLICLAKHAPHRGGLGGSSVALMADAQSGSAYKHVAMHDILRGSMTIRTSSKSHRRKETC